MAADAIFRGRIGIIGAGALGAYYGGRLARGGADVHFLMRSDYEAVRDHGLEVSSPRGSFRLKPPVYPSAAALGRCDLLLIGLKTTQNEALGELLAPTAGPETIILSLQNGLGSEEQIVAALAPLGLPGDPRERIIGGTAFLCSNRIAPGVISHTDYGWVSIAEMSGPPRPRTHEVAELFKRGEVPCSVEESLAYIRWRKLLWNVPFNGLGAAGLGADAAAVLADDALEPAARGLMAEVISAARADDVALDPAQIEKMMISTVSMGHYKSSMQLDWEAGRPLEVESILGEPLRRARRAGIPTPRLELLYGLVRRVDGARCEG